MGDELEKAMAKNVQENVSTRCIRRASVAAIGAAVILAGCGSSSGSSSSPPPADVPSSTSELASAQMTSLGLILTNSQGRTIYQFANDKDGKSTCTGSCAADWPFVPAPTSLPSSLPGVTGKLGATTRTDGARQLTISDHPVYTFSGDSAAGQTNGQGLTLNGGLWTVLTPAGAPLANSVSVSPSSGGLGY
jgi:predicted lipoprotein with Yx(FWY)xxD motif